MGRYGVALVIGLAAGACAGLLLKSFVFPVGPQPVIYGALVGVLFAYILSNMAGNRKVAAAGAAERRQALSMRAPAGKAMLVVYREGVVAAMAGLDLAVDGQEFVQLVSPQFACVILKPGAHTLTGAFGGLARAQSKAASWTFEAAPGAVLAVRITSRLGLAKGAVTFTPEPDLAKVGKRLESLRMAAADTPEI